MIARHATLTLNYLQAIVVKYVRTALNITHHRSTRDHQTFSRETPLNECECTVCECNVKSKW